MNITKIASFVLLLATLFWGAGCEMPREALSGYTMHEADTYYIDHPPNKALLDDIDNFIRSKSIPQSDIMSKVYGEDKNGQHAVFIVQKMPTPPDSEFRSYAIFYDKNNVRMKVKTWSGKSSC